MVRSWNVARPRRTPAGELLELSVEKRDGRDVWRAVVRLPLDEWSVTYTVAAEHGRPVIGELSFTPTREGEVPPGGLSARTLRRIPFARLHQVARELVRREGVGDETGTVALFDFVEQRPLERRPGRRRRPDLDYARVARAYTVAIATGSRSPVADVAQAMNEPRGFVRDMLAEARRRDLVTRPVAGRSGGDLTDKAKGLLAEAEPMKKKPGRRANAPGRDTRRRSSDADQR